jgi:hypothetical protein
VLRRICSKPFVRIYLSRFALVHDCAPPQLSYNYAVSLNLVENYHLFSDTLCWAASRRRFDLLLFVIRFCKSAKCARTLTRAHCCVYAPRGTLVAWKPGDLLRSTDSPPGYSTNAKCMNRIFQRFCQFTRGDNFTLGQLLAGTVTGPLFPSLQSSICYFGESRLPISPVIVSYGRARFRDGGSSSIWLKCCRR